MSYSELGATT